jgi:hypothetical protein
MVGDEKSWDCMGNSEWEPWGIYWDSIKNRKTMGFDVKLPVMALHHAFFMVKNWVYS